MYLKKVALSNLFFNKIKPFTYSNLIDSWTAITTYFTIYISRNSWRFYVGKLLKIIVLVSWHAWQIKVEDHSNEITAIPALLELIDIKRAIVTIDAMGT